MFQIIVERSAEKDLKKIASEKRPKLATAMRDLAMIRVHPVAGNLSARKTTGVSASETTASSMKLRTRSESSALLASAIAKIPTAKP